MPRPLPARFEPLLAGLDQRDLEKVRDATCGVFVDDNFSIGYVNRPWIDFGEANGARPVWRPGASLLDAISEPLRSFYAEKLAGVLVDGQPWEQDYECSSAEVHREYRMRVMAIAEGTGILITHTLRVEVPHHLASHPFVDQVYRETNGLIAQCGHCRRLRRAGSQPGEACWDWVPAALSQRLANVTHGICEMCSAYYFGPAML